MRYNSKYTSITIHVLQSTAKIWIDEAEKQGLTLEEFISKVLIWYKFNK